MQRVRSVMLKADPRLDECIKWQSPTFACGGNLASFNPNTKSHVSLMFHRGATIPGRFPHLEGGGSTARYMKFHDLAQVEELESELSAIVVTWCDMMSAAKKKTAKKKTAKKKTAKKKTAKKKTAKNKTAKKKTAKKKTAKRRWWSLAAVRGRLSQKPSAHKVRRDCRRCREPTRTGQKLRPRA